MKLVLRQPDRTLPDAVAFIAALLSMVSFFLAAGAPTALLTVDQARWGFPTAMLTLAFGVYAITLLGTLLVAGRLSDYVGRRPVLIATLVVEITAFVILVSATDIQMLVLGRVVQGAATGAATSAFSSVVLELAPPRADRAAASIV